MVESLVTKIRTFIKWALVKVAPEMENVFDKNTVWWYLKNHEIGVNHIGKNVKINTPYSLTNSSIGDYTYLAPNASLSNTSIGKCCSIGTNFLSGWGIHPLYGISTAPMFYSIKKQNGMTLSHSDKIKEQKRITIGNDVFIGMNVCVLDGVTIGDGAVIGAGAVVSKDIPPYAIAVGNPIKVIKYRFEEDTIKKLQDIKWWDQDENFLKEVEAHFWDVKKFTEKYG